MPPKIYSAAIMTLLVCLIGGCKSDSARTSDPKTEPKVSHQRTETTFGGDSLSFVSAVDSYGSLAVVHRFDRDTSGDGVIDPKFGDHGEPEGDWPSAWLYTLPDGNGEAFDEFVTMDAGARWVVMRRGEQLFAISAGQRWELERADVSPDPSPCMSARQASVDPTGQWLVFLRSNPARAVVKNLSNGAEREVATEGVLWRADAMPRGWVLLREVVEDTDKDGKMTAPHRQGTCICRWCGRFAASVSTGDFVGDTARETLVDGRGRRWAAPETPIPVGLELVWSVAKNELRSLDGAPQTVADGCAPIMFPLGTDRVVADCRGKTVVWNAASGDLVPTQYAVKAVDKYAPATASGSVAVRFIDETATSRVGRLNLANGQIEPGPAAIRVGSPHPSGWRLVADATKTYAWDLTTGSSREIELPGAKFDGLTAKADGVFYVVDPTKPVPEKLSMEPDWVAANGCFVLPHPRNQPQQGPFVWSCP